MNRNYESINDELLGPKQNTKKKCNGIVMMRTTLACCNFIMLFTIMIFIVLTSVCFMTLQSDIKKFLKDSDQLLTNIIPKELTYYHQIIENQNNRITHVVDQADTIITDVNNSIKEYNTIVVVNEIIANIHIQLNQLNISQIMDNMKHITLNIEEIEKIIKGGI